jgi:lysosomal alpha-mannosidase
MWQEHGLKSLHTVHRLDRLTSGVLLFCKTARKSREMEFLISQRYAPSFQRSIDLLLCQ